MFTCIVYTEFSSDSNAYIGLVNERMLMEIALGKKKIQLFSSYSTKMFIKIGASELQLNNMCKFFK